MNFITQPNLRLELTATLQRGRFFSYGAQDTVNIVSLLEEVVLCVAEFEAIRLADHKGLYHDAAAIEMKGLRATPSDGYLSRLGPRLRRP
jgi:hypothetical protein